MSTDSSVYVKLTSLFEGGRSAAALISLLAVLETREGLEMNVIPSDYAIAAVVAIVALAVLFCTFTFIWRYAEHNDEKGLDRKTNKIKARFIGGLLLAMAVTSFIGYVGSTAAVNWIQPDDLSAVDYIVCAFPIELLFGILTVILFSEGITGLGKFLEQKAKEAKQVKQNLKATVDIEALQALLASVANAAKEKEVDESAVEVDGPKEG